jgi:DNA helicase-2/ATP-dependent DNA helicase PcrA
MIDFQRELNEAQWEAVRSLDAPTLVIAGAGSGKTRTIVYRLAYLVEQGVDPESILLLTFTRKAAQEMLQRADALLLSSGTGASGFGVGARVAGGTFHSFAFSVLRRFSPPGREERQTIMDRSDADGVLKELKQQFGFGKGDRSYPKIATIAGALSKARNKEQDVRQVLEREAFHLTAYAEDFSKLGTAYGEYKRSHGLLDYDDLLFELERLFLQRPEILDLYARRFGFIMVDEYQDTNLVQARLVRLLAGFGPGAGQGAANGTADGAADGTGNGDGSPASAPRGNVMAVGDDAQSIYAFRGANVQNILSFPQLFPGARLIKLERNYRSTQPILRLTNAVLEDSTAHYRKELYSDRESDELPLLVRPISDLTQAAMVADRIEELLEEYPAEEIAVLFRAGYQSYHLEAVLSKRGMRFRKYGGLRYTEAAHVKDVLAHVRWIQNPSDFPAWQRITAHFKGMGAKTAKRLHDAYTGVGREGKKRGKNPLEAAFDRWPELKTLLDALERLHETPPEPRPLLERILELYRPVMERAYPDDYPRRQAGLDELVQIAAGYKDVDLFLADLSLESPEPEAEGEDDGAVTLSTIHSAKGLEWRAVLLLDLVEERFPSRHAMSREEDFEEERRLMYVACTRAKDFLALFVPSAIYRRGQEGTEPAMPSPFVRDLPPSLYEELRESYTGALRPSAMGFSSRPARLAQMARSESAGRFGALAPRSEAGGGDGDGAASGNLDGGRNGGSAERGGVTDPAKCGHCRHKTFGRGKIVAFLPPDKYRVNFPGMGLKVIIADYLELENDCS